MPCLAPHLTWILSHQQLRSNPASHAGQLFATWPSDALLQAGPHLVIHLVSERQTEAGPTRLLLCRMFLT